MRTPSLRTGSALALLLAGAGVPCALALQAQPARPDPKEFASTVRPVLAARCFKCHSASQQEGGVDFASIKADGAPGQQRLWRRAGLRVQAGEMPPPGEKPLTAAERALLLRWTAAAQAAPVARDPGPALVRRLTRAEYNLTVRDLLGIEFDAAQEVGLPEAEVAGGFNNLATALTFSSTLLDKYLAAADQILERVFRDRRAKDALFALAPADLPERERARQILGRFARRAYRRPAREPETERLMRLYDLTIGGGKSFEDGVRAALKPVLVSPHFLFRIEADRVSPQPYRVSDPELAVRLSYFLWSTMPDETLLALAELNRLSDPATFEAQVKRMLADPKARALTGALTGQWLQLDGLERARPSTEFFPTFTPRLREAMRAETVTFVDRLREEDRSILELLDADYTYLNAELAKHYGIPGVEGEELRRVALKPEHRRGGLLGMGSVLALTSHTSRTSPTLRGKYVLEVVFGTPPPPPPANVSMIKEEPGKAARSFREQLAQHAADPSCAGCHRKMDPLGFALDNYDAVGAWREGTVERPLDTSGELPSGEKLNGAGALKQVLLRRKDEFARNLAGQVLSYALGRELQDSDESTLAAAQAALAKDGHRFSSLILAVTQSAPFQYRQGTPPSPKAAPPVKPAQPGLKR